MTRREKVAIVGTHPRTRDDAPWNDASYDIWVFNEAAQADWVKRWDVCFQMHKPEVYTSENNFVRRDHWQWLQQQHGNKTIFMQQHEPRVPNSFVYPLDVIRDCVPGAAYNWFKSTPAYAVALAIYFGYKTIALYGLDMASNTEYGYQLPNFQFWVGVALGRGITVENHSNEQYFTGALYAYEGEIQIPREFFAERAEAAHSELKSRKWEYDKAKSRFTDALIENNYAKAQNLLVNVIDAARLCGEAEGAAQASTIYAARYDLIPRQEFERRMAEAQRDAEEWRKTQWIHQGECQYTWNAWRSSGAIQAKKQFETFSAKQVDAAREAGLKAGAYRENLAALNRYDELVTAAGGQRTLAALGV